MGPSDIDTDAFYTAHELAIANTDPSNLETDFVPKLTLHLVTELARAGVTEVLEDRERAARKIRAALESVCNDHDPNGVQFLADQPLAAKAALEHALAARATYSDMPASIRRITSQFKVVVPPDTSESPKK